MKQRVCDRLTEWQVGNRWRAFSGSGEGEGKTERSNDSGKWQWDGMARCQGRNRCVAEQTDQADDLGRTRPCTLRADQQPSTKLIYLSTRLTFHLFRLFLPPWLPFQRQTSPPVLNQALRRFLLRPNRLFMPHCCAGFGRAII